MKRKETVKSTVAFAVILVTLSGLVLLGVLYYMLRNSEPATLRWWAGIATILCPGFFAVGILMGAYGARREIAGIKTGLGEVVKAAGSIVDLRGQAAASIRKGTTTPLQTQQPPPPYPPPLDLSPVDTGPEFEVEEFRVGGNDWSGEKTIQA